MNLVDTATKGLSNAFQYVLIGVIGFVAYLSFGLSAFWSSPSATDLVEWSLHKTSLFLAFCGMGGWVLHRLALAVYWIGGDDMRHRWRNSIREYSRIYPPYGYLRPLIDKLDRDSKDWETRRKFSFARTIKMLFKKDVQNWGWADTWNSGLDVLLYVKNISPRLLDTIRLWFHIMHAQRAASYSILLGVCGAWLSFWISDSSRLSLPIYFFGEMSVELEWTPMIVVTLLLLFVAWMIKRLDVYLPDNVAQIDLSLIIAGESDFQRHLVQLERMHPE